jgi:hypothetical protein
MVTKKQPIRAGFFVAGLICLVWSGINLIKARRANLSSAPAKSHHAEPEG